MVAAGPLTVPRRAATLAAAVALAATGCGALRAAEPEVLAQPGTVTTVPTGLGPGPYALTTEEGAVITFDLPTVPAPDDEVERLRQDLRVEPVTYVELRIDNTEGTRTVQIEDLKVISHEGGQFPFETAVDVLSEWDPDRTAEGGFWRADGTALDPQEGADLDARTHALISQYTGSVPAGAEGRELMIGDFTNLPASFDDVELTPYPHERALGPAPVGHGPAQRQYRAGAPSPAQRQYRTGTPSPAPRDRSPVEQALQPPARPAVQAPRPQVPGAPANPVPATVYVPDCDDPGEANGPAQQAAWNASCAPVVVVPQPVAPAPAPDADVDPQPEPNQDPAPEPDPGPAPEPAQPPAEDPTPEPAESSTQPSEAPTDAGTIGTATGATSGASASPRRTPPSGSPAAPGATTMAAVAGAVPEGTAAPAPALPSAPDAA